MRFRNGEEVDAKEDSDRGRQKYSSAHHDLAAYEADGGDARHGYSAMEPHPGAQLQNPGKVDEALWEKGKKASQDAFGRIKYAFVTWWYKKEGGTFG